MARRSYSHVKYSVYSIYIYIYMCVCVPERILKWYNVVSCVIIFYQRELVLWRFCQDSRMVSSDFIALQFQPIVGPGYQKCALFSAYFPNEMMCQLSCSPCATCLMHQVRLLINGHELQKSPCCSLCQYVSHACITPFQHKSRQLSYLRCLSHVFASVQVYLWNQRDRRPHPVLMWPDTCGPFLPFRKISFSSHV